jgi:hypothetical protein
VGESAAVTVLCETRVGMDAYKSTEDGVGIVSKCFVKLGTLFSNYIYIVFFQSVHVAAFAGCM